MIDSRIFSSAFDYIPHVFTDIEITKSNIVLVGSSNFGLYEIDNDKWFLYNIYNYNLPDNLVYSISLDSLDNILISHFYHKITEVDVINASVRTDVLPCL